MKILISLIISSYISTLFSADFSDKYFSNCDKVLKTTFKTCYSYEYRGATASFIELDSEIINSENIKKRVVFYEDENIPLEYRTKNSDYTKSGFDRGHIQSDASNDWSKISLRNTYVMSNITPQYPNTNRYSYLEVEKRERELVNKFKKIKSLTLIVYSDKTLKNIRIPLEYKKIFYTKNYNECYIIKNDNKKYNLNEMKVNCLTTRDKILKKEN